MLKAGLFAEQAASSATPSPAYFSSPAEPSAAQDLAEPTWSLPGSAAASVHSGSASRRSSMHKVPGTAVSLSSAAASLQQNQNNGAAAAAAAAAAGSSAPGGSGFSALLSRGNTARHSESDGSKPQSSATTPGSTSPVNSSAAAGGITRRSSNSESLPTTYSTTPRSGYATPSNMHHQPPKVLETHHLQLQTHAPSGRRMINQYIIEDELGRGVHGKVRLARDTESGERVAVKIVERESKKRLGLATGGWQARMMGSGAMAKDKERQPPAADEQAAAVAAEDATASSGKQRAVDFADPPSSPGAPSSPRAQMYAAARYGRWGEGAPSRPTFADLELQKRKEKEAAKARKAQMMTTDQKVRREIAIMKKLSHENVVRLREVIDDPQSKKIFLVLEYMAGGEVIWKDARNFPTLTVAETRSIMRDVVLGLEYLHYQGIIHRDIKPANLLWDEERRVKISDFGVSHFSYALLLASGGLPSSSSSKDATVIDEHELAKTAGSPAFFAPELCQAGEASNPSTASASASARTTGGGVGGDGSNREFPWSEGKGGESGRGSPRTPGSPAVTPSGRGPLGRVAKSKPKISKAIDIWALGVTLYCLLFGHVPFTAESEFALFAVIPREDYSLPATAGADRLPIGPRKPRWRALPQWTDEEGDVHDAEEESKPDVDEATLPEEAKMLRHLLDRLLDKNPATRIKLEEVKAHPWIVQDLEDANGWLKETDPTQLPSVNVTHEEVEDALTGFSKMKRRIKRWQSKLLHSLTGMHEPHHPHPAPEPEKLFLGNRPRSRSTAEADSIIPPSPGAKSQRRTFLSAGYNRSSVATPTAEDHGHHHFDLLRRGSQASRKTTAGRSTHTNASGHDASRSQPASRPSSPGHKDAATMLRHIAETSHANAGGTSSSRSSSTRDDHRRFLWKRRSTSRAAHGGGGVSPPATLSSTGRPQVDRSSSEGHVDLSRISTAKAHGASAPNTVSSALHTSGLPLSEPGSSLTSPDKENAARNSRSKSDFWHRLFHEGGKKSSSSSRPGTAGSDASAGSRLKSSVSADKGAFRGLRRRQHQTLSMAFSEDEEKNKQRGPASASHLSVPGGGGAPDGLPPRGDSFGVIALDDEDETYASATYKSQGPQHDASATAAASASSTAQDASQAPPAHPQQIDVDDLDDDLELSDDDLGIDSRRDSYLRNDGRGWMHHYSMASQGSGGTGGGGGASPGGLGPPIDRLGPPAATASATSLTPSVEGGYNLFKPPYNGRVDLFDGVDPFEVARRNADENEAGDNSPAPQQRDERASPHDNGAHGNSAGLPGLDAITGGVASAVPIVSSDGAEAAALRRGSAQLDGLAAAASGNSLEDRSAGIKLAPPPRGYEDEDSRFADADESSSPPSADTGAGGIPDATSCGTIVDKSRAATHDGPNESHDDDADAAPGYNSLLSRWGPAAKATRNQHHRIESDDLGGGDDYDGDEDDLDDEPEEEEELEHDEEDTEYTLESAGRGRHVSHTVDGGSGSSSSGGGGGADEMDEGMCVSFEARGARPRSKSVLTFGGGGGGGGGNHM